MIKAFIFDMDGTLIDTDIIWVEAMELFLRDNGYPITHENATLLVYGKSWRDIYLDISRRFPDIGMNIEEMEEGLHPYFIRLKSSRDVRITGSIDLLKRLSKNYPAVIVSGSSRKTVDETIAELELEPRVIFSLAAEDYSPGKPNPACYLMAAKKLGVPPIQCVVFEDSAAGVKAAKQAGMYCVALARKNAPKQDMSIADEILEDLADYAPPQPR